MSFIFSNKSLYQLLLLIYYINSYDPNKSKEKNEKIPNINFDERDIDVYLPIWDFQKSENYFKKYLQEEHVINIKSNMKNNTVIFNRQDKEVKEREDQYKKEMIGSLIKKELSKEELIDKLNNNYKLYIFPNKTVFETKLPKLDNSNIFDFSLISNKINITIGDLLNIIKPICIPSVQILTISSLSKETLHIKSISSDLYQVNIFPPYKKDKDGLYPIEIETNNTLNLQLIILPDFIGYISGNIFIEFIDKSVIVVPTVIKGINNIYNIFPIYEVDLEIGEKLSTPINIFNPHNETLSLTNLVSSFNSIELLWSNGKPIKSNTNESSGKIIKQIDYSEIDKNMLDIPSLSERNLMTVELYKEVLNIEYGLLQLKTNKDTLIIPVLVKVNLPGILAFPQFLSFGIIDIGINSNDDSVFFKRGFEIEIKNPTEEPIEIETISAHINEKMLKFEINFNMNICNQGNEVDENMNENKRNLRNCIIPPKLNNPILLGYLIIDPKEYYNKNYKKKISLKELIKGEIIIKTNYQDNPIISIPYEYYLDMLVFENIKLESKLSSNNSFDEFDKNNSLQINFDFSQREKDYDILDIICSGFSSKKIETKNNNIKKSALSIIIFDKKKNINSNEIQTCNIKMSNNLVALLPFYIYDENINFIYCGIIPKLKKCIKQNNYQIFEAINKNKINKNYTIDFNDIFPEKDNKRYFYLINDNNLEIEIIKFKSFSKLLKIDYEGNYSLKGDKISKNTEDESYIQKNLILGILNIKIPKNSYIVYGISILSDKSGKINDLVQFTFKDDNKKLNGNENTFSILIKGNIVLGSLNITPSNIKFDFAFPGIIQTKSIFIKSSFKQNIKIIDVKSSDSRLIPEICSDNNIIYANNKTEILKITYNPSMVSQNQNFMRGGEGKEFSNLKYLSYKELFIWKEKQKIWEDLGNRGQTEFTTEVNILTSIKRESLKIKAGLSKPSLVKSDEINFETVEIGEQSLRFIKIENPSDEILKVKIILSPNEFTSITQSQMYEKYSNLPKNSEFINILDCIGYNSTLVSLINSDIYERITSNSEKGKNNYQRLNYHKSSHIFFDEKGEEFLKYLDKNEILEKIYNSSNMLTKTSLINSNKLICNHLSLNKREIVYSQNKEIVNKVFKSNFNKEISEIYNMTFSTYNNKNKKNGEEFFDQTSEEDEIRPKSFYQKLYHIIKLIFFLDTPEIKEKNENIRRQEFFLPKLVSEETFYIKPRQKANIGPIIYSPYDNKKSSATLFIKNNLTLLYPINLYGNGGRGNLEFYILEENISNIISKSMFGNNNKSLTIEEIINLDESDREVNYNMKKINDKLIVDINSELFENSKNEIIYKRIILKNTGNMILKIIKILIDDAECENYGIKIINCKSIGIDEISNQNKETIFVLRPYEEKELNLRIKPDFNFYLIERKINFITPLKDISLKIIINISNGFLLEKNSLFKTSNEYFHFNKILIFLFIFLIIIFIIIVMFSEKPIDQINKLDFYNFKSIINSDSTLINDYLFIKGFKKRNEESKNEYFFSDNIEKPGIKIDNNYDLVIIKEKRRFKSKRENNIYNKVDPNNDLNEFENNSEKINEEEILNKKNYKEQDDEDKKKLVEKKEKENEKLQSQKDKKIKSSNNSFTTTPPNQVLKKNPDLTNIKKNKKNDIERFENDKKLNEFEKKKKNISNNVKNKSNIINKEKNTKEINKNNTQTNNFKNQTSINEDNKLVELKTNEKNGIKIIENTEILLNDTKFTENVSIGNENFSNEQKINSEILLNEITNENEFENSHNVKTEFNRDKELLNIQKNFAAFGKNNFNIKNQVQEEEDSDEEKDSSHYNSEAKQAPWESGTEDFIKNFNFNSIFGTNGANNIKLTNYSLENQMNEDITGDDIYKSFSAFKTNTIYSGLGNFSLNPFSDDHRDDDILVDLRDEDEDIDEENKEDFDKLDDVIEDEDEEKDPDWAEEDMTVKKDGFFDETGAFKLKQTDFNFDMDKKYKQK